MPQNLETLSKKDLIDLAKKKGIKMPYLYRKTELVKLIHKKDEPANARAAKPRGRAAPRLRERTQRPARAAQAVKETTVASKRYYEPTYHAENLQPAYAVQTATQTAPVPERADLPYSYNSTKLVLMVRDPYWAFSYWDMGEETARKVSTVLKEHYGNIRAVLRVYDVTDVEFDGKNSHWNYDLDVFLEARNWYINLGIPNRSYIVDLGLVDARGNFYLIARSNCVRTPREGPSDIIDDQWLAVDFEEIYALSGGFGVGLSSAELKQRKRKLFEQLLSVPGSGISSPGISSPAGRRQEGVRGFFLEVATELIVYGRTLPDAKVTVSGDPIRLRPDGTFSLRYFLPDGEKHLPVQAVSRDDVDSRKVSIRVRKETASD